MMAERSALNRIFNHADGVKDCEDDIEGEVYRNNENYNIFSKLLNAANGAVVLTPSDVDQVIAVICKTLNSGAMLTPREETTAAIVDLLGTTAESCDEALLKYLTTNYSRLEHNSMEQQEDARTVSPVPGNKRLTLEALQPISKELLTLMDKLADWDFDIFAVEKCTKQHLRLITMTCMTELHLLDYTDFEETKLENYLTEIDKSYRDNPYHNSLHAADVVQTTYHFCTKGRLIDAFGMTPLATFALFFAAAIHDVNHGGLTNQFLVTTSAPLAVQYNDHSPLENMHLATAFGILNTPAFNFMERLPASTKKEIRRLVIAIVLATDNDRHFSLHEGLEIITGSREKAMSPISQMISRNKRLSSETPTAAVTPVTPICCNFDESPRSPTAENGELQVRRPTAIKVNSRVSPTLPFRESVSPPPQAGSLFNTINQSQETFRSVSRVKSRASMRRNSVDSGLGSRRGSSNNYMDSRGSSNNSLAFNGIASLSDKHQLLLLESVLHIADVSNPAKPWNLYSRWLDGVMTEFYNQGDKERELSMPITFAFDRYQPIPQSKFQLGFIKAIVFPFFRTFSRLNGIDVGHCLRQLDLNSNRWLEAADSESSSTKEPNIPTTADLATPVKIEHA